MYNRYLIFFLISFCCCASPSTQTTDGFVKNKAFEKELNSLLSGSVPYMNVVQLHTKQNEVTILDARELEEFNVSHIPGAKHIGYRKYDKEMLEGMNKQKPLVVYCSVGYRSEKIGEKLKKAGFQNVYNLYGSIFEWANEGFELVDENEQKTKKVHTYNRQWSKWINAPAIEKVW